VIHPPCSKVRRAPRAGRCTTAAVESLERRQLLTGIAPQTFYLSPTGSDAGNGLSPATAWQTLARVDQASFVAGDRILLQGGATFPGNLSLGAQDTGTAALPITISSYGTGRAVIAPPASDADGIDIINTAGVAISNINVTGSTSNYNGINILNNLAGDVKLSGITISHVDVGGFGFVGIGIIGTVAGSGFNDVSVLDSTLHNNNFSGLFAYTTTELANPANGVYDLTNLLVDHVIAFDNPGISGPTDAGDGILLANVDTATVQYCTAYSNGTANNSTIGGAGAIWCYDSHAVVIQYCQAYDNFGLHTDGGGFDLDAGTNDCIVQYCYSHDNTGAGLLLAQITNGSTDTGDILRYNISENDGRANDYPAIDVYGPGTYAEVTNAQIYGNDIYLTAPAAGTSAGAVRILGPTTNLRIYNNIFDVAAGITTVNVTNAGSGMVLDGNDYWAASTTNAHLVWAGTDYSTLAALRSATGQEKLAGAAVGESVDPQLLSPGNGGTVSVDELQAMTAYRLASTSPLIDAGVNLSTVNATPVATDFFGDAVPQGNGYDVGAEDVGPLAPLLITAPGGPASSIYLAPAADGVTLDVWIDSATPGAGAPTQAVALSTVTGIDIYADGGADNLTFDFTAANPLAGVPIFFAGNAAGSVGTNTLTVIAPAAGSTVTLDSTALNIGSTSIAYDSVTSIVIDGGAGDDSLTQDAQPAAPVIFNGGGGSDTLTVNAGTFTFAGDPQAATTSLTVADNAAVTFAAGASGAGIATRQLDSLTLGPGALAVVADPDVPADRAVIALGQLAIGAGATFDLGANDVLLRNQAADISTVTGWIASGYNAGAGYWNGTGLTSADAAANTIATTGIAAVANVLGTAALTASFDGLATTTADALVKYTYYGDANLDGVVDSSDTALTQKATALGITGWLGGDVNDDGVVNAADTALVANSLASQGPSLGRSSNVISSTPPTTPISPTAPGDTSPLTAVIVRSGLPAAVVAGSSTHGNVVVTVANPTAAAVHGAMTVVLYATADGTLDSSSIALGSVTVKFIAIKAGKSAPLTVPVRSIPANLVGNFSLMAQLTDPSKLAANTAAGPAITGAAPLIAFSDTLISTTLAPSDVSGQKSAAQVRLQITNNGNVISAGLSTLAFYASPDGTVASGTAIRSPIAVAIPLKPGASRTFSIPLLSLPAVSNGTYSIVVQVTDSKQNVTTALSRQTYQLAQPFVSLVASSPTIRSTADSGGVISVLITNNGNVPSTGKQTFTVLASAGAAVSEAGVIYAKAIPVRISPGRTGRITLELTPAQFSPLLGERMNVLDAGYLTISDSSGDSQTLDLPYQFS
jgi:hypothetical protein